MLNFNLVMHGTWLFAVIASFLVCDSVCQPTTGNDNHGNLGTCSCGFGFGWHFFKNKCYFVQEIEFYQFSEAENLCLGLGGRLVIIKDSDVDLFLRGFGSRTNLWIGLSDRAAEGVWKWIDNTRVTYSNWIPGQPSNYQGREDCGHLWKGTYDGKWNDAPCSSKMGFICEKNP
ncbi:perlucin-like [Glandiceps talaboti]